MTSESLTVSEQTVENEVKRFSLGREGKMDGPQVVPAP